MERSEFERAMRAAQTFHRLTHEWKEQAYYEGFMRGLRRAYHGEKFGTDEEHVVWLSLADDPDDEQRRAKGQGYRDGLTNTPRPAGMSA